MVTKTKGYGKSALDELGDIIVGFLVHNLSGRAGNKSSQLRAEWYHPWNFSVPKFKKSNAIGILAIYILRATVLYMSSNRYFF